MAAMGHGVRPTHLSCLPGFITAWHEQMALSQTSGAIWHRPALTSTRKIHKVCWQRLGLPEDQQRREKVEAVVAAAMTEYHALASSPDPDRALMERILQASRQRAKGRGAQEVTPKDIAEAARAMDPKRKKLNSPADVLPEHYDNLMAEISSLRAREAMVAKGISPAPSSVRR